MALAEAWYPVATQGVGAGHVTASRPPWPPTLGLDVTDQDPPDNVTIKGRSVEASPLSVFPTATQLVAEVPDTPDKKLSRKPAPRDGVGLTDHLPAWAVSMSMVPVPPPFTGVKK